MNNLQMQLSQLQGIIQECKRIVKKKERQDSEQQRLSRQIIQVTKQIRLKRIDLTMLKYEVKRNVKLRRQSKEIQKINLQLRRQLKESVAISKKQFYSHQKIAALVTNFQKQVDGIDKKINEAQKEIQKQVKQDQLIVRKSQRQVIYLKLQKQLQTKSASNRKYNQDCALSLRDKLRNIAPVNDLMGDIDLKYLQLCEKIQVQRQIIDKICKTQLNNRHNKTEFVKSKTEIDDQLQQKTSYHFKKKEQLNPIEKVEVASILLRQQYKKQQEDHLMGQIIRQNIKNTCNIGRIINNRYNFNLNLTEIRKIGETASTIKAFKSEGNFDYSNENSRLKKLEASKRIRTRQSQMRRHSQQYRNLSVNEWQGRIGIEPLPSSSILDVYNQLKKAQSGKNKIGNIQVTKLIRYNRRRKRMASERGGGIQICEQY